MYFTPTAANVLFAWSHDVYGPDISGDLQLNTRWIQFGAYSPIFRIHNKGAGTGQCALSTYNNNQGCALPDIWTHPYKYFDIESKAIIERAELLPYIYNASYTAYLTGLQMVRSMYIDYPDDPNAYPINNNVIMKQYMFGDDMIISPITNDVDIYQVSSQLIYLPSMEEFYEKHSGYIIRNTKSAMNVSRTFSLE